LQVAAVVAVLCTAVVACLSRALRPRRRSVAEVRAALGASSAGATPDTGDRSFGDRSFGDRMSDRVGGPVATMVERAIGNDLHLIGTDADEVAARLLVSFTGGVFAVLLSVGSMVALGRLPLSPFWLVAAVAVGCAAAATIWSDVRSRIERHRREMRRATTDFVQLVAVGLTTDQSVDEAVRFALDVGDSDLFDLLRAEVSTAPMRGMPVWEALDQLGRRQQQRELCEFATAVERQGTQGVSITESVITLARAMRERSLDELERDADRANANLAGPTMCFVVTTIVFLAYPLAIRIGDAFSG
jgi:Flp pilus assembly protein TadB